MIDTLKLARIKNQKYEIIVTNEHVRCKSLRSLKDEQLEGKTTATGTKLNLPVGREKKNKQISEVAAQVCCNPFGGIGSEVKGRKESGTTEKCQMKVPRKLYRQQETVTTLPGSPSSYEVCNICIKTVLLDILGLLSVI
ncbi:unnamed protein product [Allacma fusca]|uniref:Uncharacterized protein n=1 Tax=Allacma fusca TaxID=39272 RepID=A0A8J2LHS3_9HEXA|nr:unnamed protein product [Allacma fusca]